MLNMRNNAIQQVLMKSILFFGPFGQHVSTPPPPTQLFVSAYPTFPR